MQGNDGAAVGYGTGDPETSKLGSPMKKRSFGRNRFILIPAPRFGAVTNRFAKARGLIFRLDLSAGFCTVLPQRMFGKSGIQYSRRNAVAYTKEGGTILRLLQKIGSDYRNECMPIPAEALPHVFEPLPALIMPVTGRRRKWAGVIYC